MLDADANIVDVVVVFVCEPFVYTSRTYVRRYVGICVKLGFTVTVH